jgi:hypothetical protein
MIKYPLRGDAKAPAENQSRGTGPSKLSLKSMVMVRWLPGEPDSESSGWNIEYVVLEGLLIEPDQAHCRVGGRKAQLVMNRSLVFMSSLRNLPFGRFDCARASNRGGDMAQELWKSHEIVSLCRSIDGQEMRPRHCDTVPRS